MPAYTTDAFVLRRLQYGETDNILTLYSPERGRFSAIAKGARKAISRLSGSTEVLTLTRFGLASGKSLEIVTQVEVLASFTQLRRDLIRLAHGLYFADLVDQSVDDHMPNPVLFTLLQTGLILLESETPPELTARWFEIQLLLDLGYAPQVGYCMICHQQLPGDFSDDEQFGLSAQLGGALCPRHAHPRTNEDHSPLSNVSFRLLQLLDSPEFTSGEMLPSVAAWGRRKNEDLRLALRRTVRSRLERDLKSLAFLDSLNEG